MMTMKMKKCRRDGEEEPQLKRQRVAIGDCVSSPPNPNKKQIDEKKKLRMVCASFYIPKENPKKPRGEDAHFVCAETQTVGVADGVGGWAKLGIDSGEYARDLMTNAFDATLLSKERAAPLEPLAVLYEAYRKTAEAELKGSSTACVVSHCEGVLRWANVGDSGLMVFREKRMIRRSESQQRGFNHPFQLGNAKGSDTPESAVEAEMAVEAGDVVVLATDGLLDNVFPAEVEDILDGEIAGMAAEEEADVVAMVLAEIAQFNSFDELHDTPFSLAAREAGMSHTGGKVDDITVVVCLILPH